MFSRINDEGDKYMPARKLFIMSIVLLLMLMSVTLSVTAQTATPIPDPNATILFPPPVYVVRGEFTIYGSANLANMTGWFLEVQPIVPAGTTPEPPWEPVTLRNRSAVLNGELGKWDTTLVDDGLYTMRLNISLSGGANTFVLVSPLRVENNPPPFAVVLPTQIAPTLALPTLQPTPTTISSEPQVTANLNANVRKGDSTLYETVGALQRNETAPVLGISSLGTGWFLIRLPNGVQGWVSPTVVTATGNFNNVPRVLPPPLPTATPVPVTATPASSVNLVAGNFRFDPPSPTCSQTFNIYMDVANFGSSTSPSGVISVQDFRRADGSFQTSTVGAFPPIAPGQTINVGPIPLTVSTFHSEEHRLLMTVDGNNAIFEFNEGDNVKEAIYFLQKGPCP